MVLPIRAWRKEVTCRGLRTAFFAYLMGLDLAGHHHKRKERSAKLVTCARTAAPLWLNCQLPPPAHDTSLRLVARPQTISLSPTSLHFTLRPRFTFLSLSSSSRPTHIHTLTTLSTLISPPHSSFYPSFPPTHLPFSPNFTYLAVAVNVTVPVASLDCSNPKQLSCITLTFLPSLIN